MNVKLPMRKMPRPGCNIFITFTLPDEDDAELFKSAACGVLHMAMTKCVETRDGNKMTLMFHYTRQIHADRATARLEKMFDAKVYAQATVKTELTPAEEMIPGYRYVEFVGNETRKSRIRYANDDIKDGSYHASRLKVGAK